MKEYEEVISLVFPPLFSVVVTIFVINWKEGSFDDFKVGSHILLLWKFILHRKTVLAVNFRCSSLESGDNYVHNKSRKWSLESASKTCVQQMGVHQMQECSADQPCSIYVENHEFGEELQTTYLVPIYSVISGLHHMFAAMSLKYNTFYENQIFGGINIIRWIDYALSSSLMLVVLELLFLSPLIWDAILYCILQILIISMGYASDIARKNKEFSHALGLFGIINIVHCILWTTDSCFLQRHRASDAPSICIFVGYIIHVFSLCFCPRMVYCQKNINYIKQPPRRTSKH